MTDIEKFKFPLTGKTVRVVEIDGEPWFVANDVAKSLGMLKAHDLTRRLKESEKGARKVRTLGGEQNLLCISESGLYKAVLRSNKPEADPFVDWITEDVLPEIRKTGGYLSPQATPEQLMDIADRAIDQALKQAQIIAAMKGVLDDTWLEMKGRSVVARALGEEPEFDQSKRPLTVDEYLEGEGCSSSEARRYRSIFGRRLAAHYRSYYKKNPGRGERVIDGTIRAINVYNEEHRHLFDAVWDDFAPED